MNKIKEAFDFVIKKDSKSIKIIVAVGLIGILLLAIPEMVSNNKKEVTSDSSFDYFEYTDMLEKKLTSVISEIDGVGECTVMITLEKTQESVYATDNERKSDSNSLSSKDSYVLYDSDKGEAPVLIKEYTPTVQGVTVVCSGGDNIEVKENIINAVTSLFNISTNRISVSKLKQ